MSKFPIDQGFSDSDTIINNSDEIKDLGVFGSGRLSPIIRIEKTGLKYNGEKVVIKD